MSKFVFADPLSDPLSDPFAADEPPKKAAPKKKKPKPKPKPKAASPKAEEKEPLPPKPKKKKLPFWVPVQRDFFVEAQKGKLRNWDACDAGSHPLSAAVRVMKLDDLSIAGSKKKGVVADTSKKTSVVEGIWDDDGDMLSKEEIEREALRAAAAKDEMFDPLTAASMGFDDPLVSGMRLAPVSKVSAMEAASPKKSKARGAVAIAQEKYKHHEDFRRKRTAILQKYTSNLKVGVTAFFLDEDGEDEAIGKSSTARVEEMVDDSSLFLSQKEYIRRMENNVLKLRQAWREGKRVLSLKIAIQCSKMLSPKAVANCPQFYPSMYVLVAEVLDSFGDLVFQRLHEKACLNEEEPGARPVKLRPNWTFEDINRVARETCLNWFYKIACIRELMPRLFIELSLFKCWRYVRPAKEYKKILRRLSRTVRGIGDPLVQAYARTYMVHRGFEVCGNRMRPILLETFDDFLFLVSDLEKRKIAEVVTVVQSATISEAQYIDLYRPSINWLVHCLSFAATEEEFDALLKRYKETWNNGVVLAEIVASFDDAFVSAHCRSVAKLIKSSVCNAAPASEIYRELGRSVVRIAPAADQRLALLNDVWSPVSKMTDCANYMAVVSVWVEYVLQHFGTDETDTMLADVIKHLKKELRFGDFQGDIYNIVMRVVNFAVEKEHSLRALFSISNVLPLFEMLHATNQLSATKIILDEFVRSNGTAHISDPVFVQSLLEVCRMHHDSLAELRLSEDGGERSRKYATHLICHVIDCVDYGHDLEKQLNQLVECRSMFSNLDGVLQQLVTHVSQLAMRAFDLMRGKHTKKTGAFVKACIAYCHITIPSLSDIWPRMYLFATCAQVALTNSMVTQSEALIHSAIIQMASLPTSFSSEATTIQSTSSLLSEWVQNLASLLLLMPGHPEHGPFYLLLQLDSALHSDFAPWNGEHMPTADKIRAHLAIFKAIVAMSQKKLPYHILGVDSNDVLFGHSTKYLKVTVKKISALGAKVVEMIESLHTSDRRLEKQECGYVCLEVINVLVSLFAVDEHLANSISHLFQFAISAPSVNKPFLNNTLAFLAQRNAELFKRLVDEREKWELNQ